MIAARLREHDGLRVHVEKLADADWLAMALSGLPPVRALGRSSLGSGFRCGGFRRR